MIRVIKVEDKIYDELDKLRIGRQTFSDVVTDLLGGRLRILEAMSALEGILRFREWQRDELYKIQYKKGLEKINR